MSDPKPLPPQETLLRHFSYDRASGELRWRVSGKRAGWIYKPSGYRYVMLEGAAYRVHRVIWKMEYGTEPEEIDHVDRDKDNSRLENLRVADRFIQCQNQRARPRSTTQSHGIQRSGTLYAVRFGHNGQRVSLGSFPTLALAEEARDREFERLGRILP